MNDDSPAQTADATIGATWSPAHARSLTDQLTQALIVTGLDGQVAYANPAAEALLGWPPGGLTGRAVDELVPVRYRDRHAAGFARFAARPHPGLASHPLHLPALRADGSEVDVEIVLRAVAAGENAVPTHVVGSLRPASPPSVDPETELAALLLPVLAEAVTLEDAIDDVLEVLAGALECAVSAFWSLDEATGELTCRHFHRSGSAEVPGHFEIDTRSRRLGLGDGLPGRVWVSRTPEWITDTRYSPIFPRSEAAVADGLRCGFGFPVAVPGRFLGVIELYAEDVRDPDNGLLVSLASVGVELAHFLDRRRVEDERAALQRGLSFLAEASALLATSLDPQRVLEDVAALAVRELATWCVVRVLEDGTAVVKALAHEDPAQRGLLEEIHRRYAVDLASNYGTAYVLRSGRSTYAAAVPEDWRDRLAHDAHHRDMLGEVDLSSVAIVPLSARGRVLGSLMLGSTGERRLDSSVRVLAEELGRRAGLALDNARMHHDLALREALLRVQTEAGLEGMVVLSADDRVISHNHRFVEMFDPPASVMTGAGNDSVLPFLSGQVVDPAGFLRHSHELVERHEAGRDEVTMLDGRVFDRHGSPLRAADGAALGYAWYFRDITDERRVRQQLFESGERFATLARTLQQSLLPSDLPDVPGLEMAARYRPAGAGVDVGGDFYDVFRIGRGRWGVVIGDVCGKGAEAAALTALSRYTIRAAAMQTRSPARALAITNEAIRREIEPDGFDARFATIAFVMITVREKSVTARLSLGGHLLPMHVPRAGAVAPVGRSGELLGLFPEVELYNTEVGCRRATRSCCTPTG